MPHYIVKLSHEEKDFYMEYSTIVDAPITRGMSLEEFTEYYRDEYGASAMSEFSDRMRRVEEKGTSSRLHETPEQVFVCNRAGINETFLTMEQIIEAYCGDEEKPIEGRKWSDIIAEEEAINKK